MTHPSDIAGLSARLNDAEGVGACLSGDPQFIKALCKEAATALNSLSARVKELEAELFDTQAALSGVNSDWNAAMARALRAEQQRDEAYERAAALEQRLADQRVISNYSREQAIAAESRVKALLAESEAKS